MLWPTRLHLEESSDYGDLDDVRYGFVDVTGTLVIPQRYDGYVNCPDATGRTAFVIASSVGHRDKVFDLSGKLLARTPTGSSDCGGANHVIVTVEIDAEVGTYNSGLMDVATGDLVVPIARDRHIMVVDAHTVNVSDPSGEYFLDLTTMRRTPHQGWLSKRPEGGDTKLFVASAKRQSPTAQSDPKVGFINRSGAWVLPPEFDNAEGLANGYFLITVGGKHTFLDAALHRTGGTWDDVAMVYRLQSSDDLLGYKVTRGAQQALLGLDLKAVIAPGPVSITCEWDASGACSLVAKDSRAFLVVLPAGAAMAMPDGFTQALNPSLVADNPDPEDGRSRRVRSLVTGATVELAAPAGCAGVGLAWVACESGEGMAPPVVINDSGELTPFATAEAVADPSPNAGVAYYWVTAGRYQGFVDAAGVWRYRESRFTQLED